MAAWWCSDRGAPEVPGNGIGNSAIHHCRHHATIATQAQAQPRPVRSGEGTVGKKAGRSTARPHAPVGSGLPAGDRTVARGRPPLHAARFARERVPARVDHQQNDRQQRAAQKGRRNAARPQGEAQAHRYRAYRRDGAAAAGNRAAAG